MLYQVELRPSTTTSGRKSGDASEYRCPLAGSAKVPGGRVVQFAQVSADDAAVEPRRPQALDAGLFLLVAGLPLAVFPLARQPFADPKLAVLLLGTVLLWLAGTGVDRRLRVPAAMWASVCVVAALAGADPAGSVLGPWDSTGLLLLLASAALLPVASAVPARAWDRAGGWLVWVAVAVAVVAVAWRLAPDALGGTVKDLSFDGSTLGNPVFAVALLSAAIPAAVSSRWSERRLAFVLVLIASGLAVNGERSSLILPAVALVTCIWPSRALRRRVAVAAGVVLATIALWGLASPVLPDGGLRQAGGQFSTLAGEQDRLAVWSANARSVGERPVFGWGPGLAWSAFVSSATGEELEVAGRGWADAHALPLQLLVTTGVVGLLAFALLAWRLLPGLLRPPHPLAWTAASAIVIGAFSLYEPLNVALTPLLFLFAGAANGERADVRASASSGLRPALAPAVALCLVVGLVVSGTALIASSLEQWSRTHFEPSAIRASVRLMPWRLSATERYAIELALDGRAGDPAAAAEARQLIAGAVDDHPWDPGVRLIAADVEMLLRNPAGVQPWIDDHLERFPNDDVAPPPPEDLAADVVPAA